MWTPSCCRPRPARSLARSLLSDGAGFDFSQLTAKMNDATPGQQGQARGDAAASTAAAAASMGSSEVGGDDAASGKAKGSGTSKTTGGGGGHEQDAKAIESGNKHAAAAAATASAPAAAADGNNKAGPKSGHSLRNTATRLANILSETALVRRPRLSNPLNPNYGFTIARKIFKRAAVVLKLKSGVFYGGSYRGGVNQVR